MSKTEEIKAARIAHLMDETPYKFVTFKGGSFMSGPDTQGLVPFDRTVFGRLAQTTFRGLTENAIADFATTIRTLAPDKSHTGHRIAFADQVWDMRALEYDPDTLEYVYSSSVAPVTDTRAADRFLLELAKGDALLARDYLQACAPLLMDRRPSGVVWFVGDGANGKSSLISALYRIMGKHLVSLTASAIEDGRATPSLRGCLGNIVRETSEGRIEDTERYKAIGTHEPFEVRQLNTHDMIRVETDFHTIFNANNVPVFADKTKGARRRTLVVPFPAHFEDDPTFDDRTFTPAFLGGLITLLQREARLIRDAGYKYQWSEATLEAKREYDSEVNSAEAFVDHLETSSVRGFTNYQRLRNEYDSWCAQNGFVSLGVTSLKRTMNALVGPVRKAIRTDGVVTNRYLFAKHQDTADLVWLSNGYGMEGKTTSTPVPSNERISSEW